MGFLLKLPSQVLDQFLHFNEGIVVELMRHLGEEFPHFRCQILHRSIELVHSNVKFLHDFGQKLSRLCVHCQFSITPTLVFGILRGLLLQVSNEIVDHLSYLVETVRLVIWSGTR